MLRVIYSCNLYYLAHGYGHYYISHNNGLSKKLDISLKKFNGMVIEYNGFIKKGYIFHKTQYWDHQFNKREDCEKFLESLEPYIIMQKLTEV